jgi:hypothetical protein
VKVAVARARDHDRARGARYWHARHEHAKGAIAHILQLVAVAVAKDDDGEQRHPDHDMLQPWTDTPMIQRGERCGERDDDDAEIDEPG